MPHAAIYHRPQRRPQQDFVVNVRTEEGREQYTVRAETKTMAEREALEIYAAEHDTAVAVWTEAH